MSIVSTPSASPAPPGRLPDSQQLSEPISHPQGLSQQTPPQIIFEYHPASKRPPRIFNSYEDSLKREAGNIPAETEGSTKPWYPFPTLPDFDFAEFVSENRLSIPTIDSLLDRLRRVWAPATRITVRNGDELKGYIDASISERTKVRCLQLRAYTKYPDDSIVSRDSN